jgi:Ca2+-binding RTX toxin-like protein
MASPTVNTFIIAPDGAAEFSDQDDTVALAGFTTILGLKTRMMAGADRVTLSNVFTGGWNNQINGNLGADLFTAVPGSQTRDLVLGGRDGDTLNLSAATGGADWLNGNLGNDIITAGGTAVGSNVLRGGGGDDQITGSNSNDILVGDFGKDSLTSRGGQNVFMMRTDDGLVEGINRQNATQNAGDCDVIQDYSPTFDKIAIAGIASISDLTLAQVVGDVLISASNFTNGTTGTRFICLVKNTTVAALNTATAAGNGLIIGNRADTFLANLTPENFLINASPVL